MSRRGLSRFGCAVVAAVAATGCGTGADRAQVRATAERFYAAVQAGDGRTACAQLSPDLRAQVVKDQPGGTCSRAVQQLSLQGRRAAVARVYATSGMVQLRGGDTVFLGDTKQGWRIEAVGCRPSGSGPLDCEEQA